MVQRADRGRGKLSAAKHPLLRTCRGAWEEHLRGVDVRLLVDDQIRKAKGEQVSACLAAGIPVASVASPHAR